MSETLQLPYAESALARLFRDAVANLPEGQSLRALALRAGYDKPNVLTMYLRGEARMPIERALALGDALALDPGVVFRAALEQWCPRPALDAVFARIVTARERRWLDRIAAATGRVDAEPTPEALAQCAQAWGGEAA